MSPTVSLLPLPDPAPIQQAQKIISVSLNTYTDILRDLRHLDFELCDFLSPSGPCNPKFRDFEKPHQFTPCMAARLCTMPKDYAQAAALRREAKALLDKVKELFWATLIDQLDIFELKREGVCARVWRRLRGGGVEVTPRVEAVEAVWRWQEEPERRREVMREWEKVRVSVRMFLGEAGQEAGWNEAAEKVGKGPRCDECGTLWINVH